MIASTPLFTGRTIDFAEVGIFDLLRGATHSLA
jgi:hypothetical protein